MPDPIESEKISASNFEDAFEVADRCFPTEWSQARVREDFGRIASGEVTFYEPELDEEVNLLEYYLHRVTGNVVGLSGLYNYSSKPTECWLGWFCIDPDEQNKGYGHIVLDHIVHRAMERGMDRIFLHTERSNEDARKFYEKNGFTLSAEADYWNRDLVRYERDLSAT